MWAAKPARRSQGGGKQATDPLERLLSRVEYRLGIADALILQSFRADYPVQGNKTKQFEQVGNAIPPLLARHALNAVRRTVRP